MAKLLLSKLTTKGQMTVPQELRSLLGLEAGDYVVLRPLMGGIFISKASVEPEVTADAALHHYQTEAKGEGPPRDAEKRIAELTLAYLGREAQAQSGDQPPGIDPDTIAQALSDLYGTEDMVQIVDRVRGRGGS
jgi:AbrB family looped-hinge helix DNA binding protein